MNKSSHLRFLIFGTILELALLVTCLWLTNKIAALFIAAVLITFFLGYVQEKLSIQHMLTMLASISILDVFFYFLLGFTFFPGIVKDLEEISAMQLVGGVSMALVILLLHLLVLAFVSLLKQH